MWGVCGVGDGDGDGGLLLDDGCGCVLCSCW